jgi:hypothetical protein
MASANQTSVALLWCLFHISVPLSLPIPSPCASSALVFVTTNYNSGHVYYSIVATEYGAP